MKIKTLLVRLLLMTGVASASAQTDSICISNSSVSHEAVRAGNFKDAYQPWRVVLDNCPLLRFYTFTDGFRILKYFLDEDNKANNNARTSEEYKKYFDELMEVHDLRLKYIPEFQKTVKNVPSVESSIGVKAIDYISYAPNPDVDQAYAWLSESANSVQGQSSAPVLHYFLEMSMNKLKKDESHKEQFIQDYLNATQYVDEAIENAKDGAKDQFQNVKDNLVALFINSGAADCESLQEIYGDKVEENKNDLEYLKKVIDIMKMMKCTEEEAYFQASYYVYQIEPTTDAAVGCAYMAFKKGDIDGAVKFFDESIDLETDNIKKAEKAYMAAAVLTSAKKLSQARSYCQKAISYNENYGAPYIMIAQLYATSPNWSDESALNKCTYFLIVDKLQRAKVVDPSVAEEANKLIGTYSRYTPSAQDLFMLGYKAGDRITIGGWIGEATTIR